MVKQEMPEWITVIFLIIILGAIFPVAMSSIINSIFLGIILGVVAAIVIIVVWWWITQENYSFY